MIVCQILLNGTCPASQNTYHIEHKKISMFELTKLSTPKIYPMTINEYSGPRLTLDMSLDT